MRLINAAARGALALLMAAGLTATARAETNVIYILDASNSMWGQIDGTAKIETARGVMGDLLSETGDGTTVGLMVYGHRTEGQCDDIEMLSALGASTADELKARLAEIKPKGKTPIAGALTAAGEAFPTNDANNNVVLISDGIETCSGDPCAVAEGLATAGVNTKIHAVGFDVDDAAREQLECIADKGNGAYYNASNADELQVALAEVREVVEAAPPEPAPEPEPVASQFFFDDFDDGQLAEDWVVNSPNPDAFIVENGNLLMLNGGIGGFGIENSQNLIVLKRDLPDGDWDAHMVFTGELQTGKDTIWFGLYTDKDNYLGAQYFNAGGCCGCAYGALRNRKRSGGESTDFTLPVIGKSLGCGAGYETSSLLAETEARFAEPVRLSLHKRGRSYHASLDIGQKTEDGQPIVHTTDVLTSLRVPGELALAIGKWEDAQGEVLVNIDSVEVVAVE